MTTLKLQPQARGTVTVPELEQIFTRNHQLISEFQNRSGGAAMFEGDVAYDDLAEAQGDPGFTDYDDDYDDEYGDEYSDALAAFDDAADEGEEVGAPRSRRRRSLFSRLRRRPRTAGPPARRPVPKAAGLAKAIKKAKAASGAINPDTRVNYYRGKACTIVDAKIPVNATYPASFRTTVVKNILTSTPYESAFAYGVVSGTTITANITAAFVKPTATTLLVPFLVVEMDASENDAQTKKVTIDTTLTDESGATLSDMGSITVQPHPTTGKLHCEVEITPFDVLATKPTPVACRLSATGAECEIELTGAFTGLSMTVTVPGINHPTMIEWLKRVDA